MGTGSEWPTTGRMTDVPSLIDDEGDFDGTKTSLRAARTDYAAPRVQLRPFLLVLAGPHAGQTYRLEHAETLIGRWHGAGLKFDDDNLSRKHAKITIQGAKLFVEDLKSANGTLVNGLAIEGKQPLNDGDQLTLGSTVLLKFTSTDKQEAAFRQSLREAGSRDELTGAWNKASLATRLAAEIEVAKQRSTPLSLIVLDVDHLESVNKTFGEATGDKVLIKVASAVTYSIGQDDILTRLVGGTFAVLCPRVDAVGARALADRLRELVAARAVEHPRGPVAFTVSLGIATFPESAPDSPERLLAEAAAALYQAKELGRNRVVLSPER